MVSEIGADRMQASIEPFGVSPGSTRSDLRRLCWTEASIEETPWTAVQRPAELSKEDWKSGVAAYAETARRAQATKRDISLSYCERRVAWGGFAVSAKGKRVHKSVNAARNIASQHCVR